MKRLAGTASQHASAPCGPYPVVFVILPPSHCLSRLITAFYHQCLPLPCARGLPAAVDHSRIHLRVSDSARTTTARIAFVSMRVWRCRLPVFVGGLSWTCALRSSGVSEWASWPPPLLLSGLHSWTCTSLPTATRGPLARQAGRTTPQAATRVTTAGLA
jgi:hypothetical protein